MNTGLEQFIRDQVVPFHCRNVDALLEKHPHIMGMVNTILADKDNRAAIQITDNGKVVGEYTLYLKGLYIEKVDSNLLASEIHHPFLGVIKPYVVVERTILERIVADESSFLKEPFSAGAPYLPDITIKFLS